MTDAKPSTVPAAAGEARPGRRRRTVIVVVVGRLLAILPAPGAE